MKTHIPVLAALCIIATAFSGCAGTSPPAAPVPSATPETTPFPISSPATGTFSIHADSIADGQALPMQYTCTGAGESPEISWQNVPSGTMSLALILEDPDAPRGTFTHWIVYNILPDTSGIPAGVTAIKELADGAKQGENTAGNRGYTPPCPPVGTAHRYVFRLYALDYEIGLPYADREEINQMISSHVIGETAVTTTFRR